LRTLNAASNPAVPPPRPLAHEFRRATRRLGDGVGACAQNSPAGRRQGGAARRSKGKDMKLWTRIALSPQVGPHVAVVLVACALSGCGAEVAGGAATVGALQAEQAKQAQARKQEVVEGFKAAQEAGVARAASAAD
jgi:hypothetical protein